jgi:hypothetical protein
MRQFKLLIAAVTLSLASCSAYAIEPVGEDGKSFRFTDEEIEFCKANGGCTIVTGAEIERATKHMIILQQALAEAEKQLKAEKSKRCI